MRRFNIKLNSTTLLTGSSYSPYIFVRILATQIGSEDEAPRFALLQLRLAVLLSLATHGPRLPLLVLGADLVFAHRLLRSALELCPLPSVFSQLIPPSAVLYRDQNGVHHLQAGQLQRAEGGVLYLGQLAALKSSVRQQVITKFDPLRISNAPRGRCSRWWRPARPRCHHCHAVLLLNNLSQLLSGRPLRALPLWCRRISRKSRTFAIFSTWLYMLSSTMKWCCITVSSAVMTIAQIHQESPPRTWLPSWSMCAI